MGMMKNIVNVGRKFRTAYMKTARRKTTAPKPLSEDWRARNRAGDHQARNEFKKHMKDTNAYVMSRPDPAKPAKRSLNEWDWETEGIPEHARRSAPKISSKSRITYKGQDMQERNFMKSHKMVGGIRYGTFVSKEAYRTGKDKAVKDAYGRKGYTNYKSRVYQR